MNMRQRDGFIATDRDNEAIAEALGAADSVNYLSISRFKEAVGRVGSLCMACTNGNYPEPIEAEMIEEERIAH
jgi:glutamine phosphoribosylpyrophosphate amidotransferase